MGQLKMARQALYTVKEACDALFGEGYSEASRKRVRRWISNGQLNAIQDGSRWFIPRGEIAKMGGDVGQESNKLDA
jgi:excisionase family DNA binding protein